MGSAVTSVGTQRNSRSARPVHDLQSALEGHRGGTSLVYGLEDELNQGKHGRIRLRKRWGPTGIETGDSNRHPFSKTHDSKDTKGITTVDTLANMT
jgi:hypothetical protein